MNELTEAIAKRAAQYAIEFATKDQELYFPKFVEKFAELIIQECAEIARHNVSNISSFSDAEWVEEKVKEHFGVEE